MSETTQQFLKTWGIRHRVSSVAFPHSNCRAELAVKTAKRLIRDNVGPQGSLDTDKFARALMQYRNTPLQGINLSPAQILLGRSIRDFFPFIDSKCKIRKEWLITAEDREKALARRHATHLERLSLHTHELPPLIVGDSVLIQNQMGNHPTRWDKTGVIVERGPGPRQYYVRADGSGRISLRNRRFLRKCTTVADPPSLISVPSSTQTHLRPSSHDDASQDIMDTESSADNYTPPASSSTPSTPPDDTSDTTQTTQNQHQLQPTLSDPPPTPLAPRRSSRMRRPPERYGNCVSY
jgi:hypothetical protein